MEVTSENIDDTLKLVIQNNIALMLLLRDGCIPMPPDKEIALSVLTQEVMAYFVNRIKEYYLAFFNQEVLNVRLTTEDYLDIYVNAA